VEVHTLETELKKCKKLVLRLEKELASAGASVEKEKELTKKLLERDAELRELRKKRGSYMDPDASGIALQEAEDRLADLEDHAVQLENELDDTRRILDAKEAENEDLKDVIARGPSGGKLVALEDENTELRERLADFEDELARRDDEREALLDELESVKLTMEEMERRREAEAQERSVSRAEIYEREEEREVMESEINTLRDKLSRAHLDLEMREEDLDQREREMEDIVEQVREKEELWKGEFEEVEAKNEELRAVSGRPSIFLRENSQNTLLSDGRREGL
jgi:chromosome segregation ATPase